MNSRSEGDSDAETMRMGHVDRDAKKQLKFVIGPDGATLTLPDLPATPAQRWVMRRKAQVVAAVQGGLLTLDDACERYALSVEEYLSWQNAIARFGVAGLRATHAQEYRHHDQHHPHH
jgi:hypothetical protein